MKDLEKNRTKIKQFIADGDVKKVYSLLGFAGEAVVQEAFATKGFGKWQPLDEKTIKRKGSSSILIDSGELRKSISSKAVKK